MSQFCAAKPLKCVDRPPDTAAILDLDWTYTGFVGDVAVQPNRYTQAQCQAGICVGVILSIEGM